MIKLISVVTICYLLSSCNQNSTSTHSKDLNESNHTSNISTSIKIDTSKLNIDGLKVSPRNFRLLLENEYIRMLEYSLKPGEKDTPHTHPPKSSYVVSGGKIKVYLENGEVLIFDEKAGTAGWGDYVGKHYVENIGTTTVTIVLTEIKSLQ